MEKVKESIPGRMKMSIGKELVSLAGSENSENFAVGHVDWKMLMLRVILGWTWCERLSIPHKSLSLFQKISRSWYGPLGKGTTESAGGWEIF